MNLRWKLECFGFTFRKLMSSIFLYSLWTNPVDTMERKQSVNCFLFLTSLLSFSVASVMYLNSMSVTWTTRIQIFLTFSKLLAMAIIIVPGIYLLFKGKTQISIVCIVYYFQTTAKTTPKTLQDMYFSAVDFTQSIQLQQLKEFSCPFQQHGL